MIFNPLPTRNLCMQEKIKLNLIALPTELSWQEEFWFGARELDAQGPHLHTQYLGPDQRDCRFCTPNIWALFYDLRTQYWTGSTATVGLEDSQSQLLLYYCAIIPKILG